MEQHWKNNDSCELKGVDIIFSKANQEMLTTTNTCIYVLKGKEYFEYYNNLVLNKLIKNVFEIGIFEGGSAILFADLWEKSRIIGIDNRSKNIEVMHHIDRFGFSDRIKLFYGVSQDDKEKITGIINNNFDSDIDLVFDDASHQYDLTKSTFEIVFPFLKNGGLYVIEDWGWAHWKDWQDPNHYSNKIALSNFIFELVMASASSSNIISSITINAGACIIEKSIDCPKLDSSFIFNDLYVLRGKQLNLI